MKSEKEMFEKNSAQQQLKKLYITPWVTVYGTVETITRAGGGSSLPDLARPGDVLFGSAVAGTPR